MRDLLESFYSHYNDPAFIGKDPVVFPRRYRDVRDREVVGLLAAGLAYGRVASIFASTERVLDALGPSPADRLESDSRRDLECRFEGFKHRWTTGDDVVDLLVAVRAMQVEQGSLQAGFISGLRSSHGTIQPALSTWVNRLTKLSGKPRLRLLSDPALGSACKRLCLYLRWMVREDRVDPGGWSDVSSSQLLVPVDVHMHRVGKALGFTNRNQANGRTSEEITLGFRGICSEDPVKYDFALTRPGILDSVDLETTECWQDLLPRSHPSASVQEEEGQVRMNHHPRVPTS